MSWLASYKKNDLSGDLSAGLTVGVMLIPQGMAYAMLAGLPPIYGLYASTIPLILYAVLGTSRQLSVGPVAMISLLIASGIGTIASSEAQFISLAILLTLMVGIIQLGLGVLRLGFLVNFLSHPVISGFTSAAALIIGFNQLKHLLGLDIPRSNQIHDILISLAAGLDEIGLATSFVGIGGVLVILISRKYMKRFPGPLVAVVFGVLVVYIFSLKDLGVAIVGSVPAGLPPFGLPVFEFDDMIGLLPTALTISLVGFMESIAVAKAMQARHKNYKLDSNQELIALGMANIGGSFFNAFPTTGGFSRTAVNDQAGAKTGMASIISAVLVLLTLLFLTPLFYFLPKAILASIILVAVYGLIDYKEVIHLWRTDRRDLAMLLVTFFATLTVGIEQGILIGVALSLIMVLYRSSYPHFASLGRIPGTDTFRNLDRFDEAIEIEGVLIFRFDAQLFFGNVQLFKDTILRKVQESPHLKLIIVNAEAINHLDSSAIHMLHELSELLEENGSQLVFACVKGPVRDVMVRNDLLKKFGANHFFNSIEEALSNYDGNQIGVGSVSFQTNLSDK